MLKTEHLRKNYGDFSLDCSMEVKPGSITGLIGRNGAGKSTTFKVILGIVRPDGGSAELFGKPISEITPKDKENIGVALSDSGFSQYLSIAGIANVLNGMYPGFDKARFLDRCRRFDLPEKKQVKEFSTGMKAKLKVLVALSHKAQFLILDEPTVGLDVVARDEILSMLRDYMEEDESRSILISSHISSDLEQLCDDLYMIHEGSIILHEDTDVLLSQYGVVKVPERDFGSLDKSYMVRAKREPYGYACLTSQRQFYIENYPSLAVESGNIDDLIMILEGGFGV